MIVFAPCKINLGLHIVEKRSDGYHNIQTIFYPIGLYDILEIIDATEFKFSMTGIENAISKENNLCIKAIRLLVEKKYIRGLPKIHFHLHKNIPIGAGLGGGSSNASYVLMMMNEYFNIGLSKDTLLQFAEVLGSDCPFFIEKKPCFSYGKGEQLIPIELDLSTYKIVLVKPDISISTAWAYNNSSPKISQQNLLASITLPISQWKDTINNDFEDTIFSTYPYLLEIKQTLYHSGALFAGMSGSGSTLFGIFKKNLTLNFLDLQAKNQVFFLY
ncbi:MAG: 4-(cytidine 5'-diphospho)-2-C-methyl-D-erythritol kinase [Chitinophagaceae bacterium]